jgi:hypothetical protein
MTRLLTLLRRALTYLGVLRAKRERDDDMPALTGHEWPPGSN